MSSPWALLLAACTGGNKVTPHYDAGFEDEGFEQEPANGVDAGVGDAGTDAGADGG